MKTDRLARIFLIIYTLLFLSFFPISVSASESDRVELIISSIVDLPLSSLIEKSKFLNLPISNERGELIKNLFDYYGYTPVEKGAESLIAPYLTINKTDAFYVNETKGGIILDGNVSINFEGNSLQAQSIIYNDSLNFLNAIGNVTFEQKKDEEMEVLTASSLIYNTITQEIILNKGNITSSNSDKDGNVTQFLSRGEKVTLAQEPFLIAVEDSSLTTSVDNDYYQIKSKDFYVHEGNDLFLSSSFLYIGRVPILYIPFFFYPGKTLIFNPSFGYDISKGFQVFTSYELYGKNPLIHEKEEGEGITSFFSGEQTLEKGSSYTYEDTIDPNISRLEAWATKSSSFGTIYADSYQKNGIFLGYEGVHNFFDKTMNASILAGLAYKNPSDLPNGALFRYLLTPTFSYKKKSTSINLSLPFYSDSEVKKEYLQRDIRTRLLELASINTKEENTIGSINSFTWEFRSSTSFAPQVLQPYINSLSISKLNSNLRFEKHYDPAVGGFIINDATPIDFSAKMNGTLLDFKWKGKEKDEVKSKLTYSEEQKNALTSYQLSFPPSKEKTSSTLLESFLKVSYEIKQDFKGVLDYTKGEQVDTTTSINNTSFITLESRIGPKIITFNHSLKSLLADTSTDTKESTQYEISSDNSITLPFAHISYTFNQRIYRASYQKVDLVTERNKGFTDFSSDYVKIHTLSYAPTYTVQEVVLRPSVTFQLPPLDITFTPKLLVSYKNITSSVSIGVKEDDSSTLEIFRGNFSFSYKGEIVTFSNNANYTKNPTSLHFYEDLKIDTSLGINVFNSYLKANASSLFNTKTSSFEKIAGSVSLPFIDVSIRGTQVDKKIVGESLDVKLINSLEKKLWWKNRISLSYGVSALYHHSFVDSFGSFASIDFSLTFDIYKFLTIKTSVKSVNRGLYRYNDIEDLLEDLLKSFDFFGNGRNTTQFIMDSFSLSLIHYMDDWNLYVTYEASMENVNNRLVWSPVLKILVKWKAINEIKVDREVKL